MNYVEQVEKGLLTREEAFRLACRGLKKSAEESLKASREIKRALDIYEQWLKSKINNKYSFNPNVEDFNN